MYSSTIHESRNLKQARPCGQYVDLLRYTLATPSWDFIDNILSLSVYSVKQPFRSPPNSKFTYILHITEAVSQLNSGIQYNNVPPFLLPYPL